MDLGETEHCGVRVGGSSGNEVVSSRCSREKVRRGWRLKGGEGEGKDACFIKVGPVVVL